MSAHMRVLIPSFHILKRFKYRMDIIKLSQK